MSDNEQQIIAEFDKCPGCGSTNRLAGSVADEQKAKGLLGEDWKLGIYQMGGVIVDPNKVNQMLVGTKVPVVSALVDVCMDCGMIFAVRLVRGEKSLQAVQMPPLPPGSSLPPMSG